MTEQYPQYSAGYGQQPQPYYGGPPAGYGPPPDNNLVWAILSTVLCCMPLGIVAIVKSSQVNTLWYLGFHAEARKAAEDVKTWAMWSAISLGILLLLYVAFIVVMIIIFGLHFNPLPGHSQGLS